MKANVIANLPIFQGTPLLPVLIFRGGGECVCGLISSLPKVLMLGAEALMFLELELLVLSLGVLFWCMRGQVFRNKLS